MSEKKRGFLGRLFSGKDKNETPEAERIDTPAESPAFDASQSEPEPADTGLDAAPDLTEPPAVPPIAEETLFTGIGAEEEVEIRAVDLKAQVEGLQTEYDSLKKAKGEQSKDENN